MLTLVREQRGRPLSPQKMWEFSVCVGGERKFSVYYEFFYEILKVDRSCQYGSKMI